MSKIEQEQTERTPGLEERFEAIEQILDQMEDADVTLEDSFALYKKGLEELGAANAMLDEMESAMRGMLAPDRQGERGAAGAPSGGDAAGGSPVERLAARLAQMGLVDTDENGGAGGNGANVPRRPDGYR